MDESEKGNDPPKPKRHEPIEIVSDDELEVVASKSPIEKLFANPPPLPRPKKLPDALRALVHSPSNLIKLTSSEICARRFNLRYEMHAFLLWKDI